MVYYTVPSPVTSGNYLYFVANLGQYPYRSAKRGTDEIRGRANGQSSPNSPESDINTITCDDVGLLL